MNNHENKDWLYDQYVNKERTMEDIGKECGVSRKTIKNRLDKFKIAREEVKYPFNDRDWLYEEYIVKNRGMEEIGKQFGFTKKPILNALKKFDFEKKPTKDVAVLREKTTLKNHGVTNPMKSKKIQNKAKQTNLERYGTEYAQQSEKVKEKTKQTSLERYGVPNVMILKETQEKHKETMKERHGHEYFSQVPEFQEKKKQLNLKRYGTEEYFNSEDFKNKTKDNLSHSEEANEKRKLTIQKKYLEELEKCAIPLFTFEEYEGTKSKKKYKWQCKCCNNIFEDDIFAAKKPRCYVCEPVVTGVSLVEKEVANFVKGYYNIEENNRFYYTDINWYELDIYIPELSFGIEFDGLHWHSQRELMKRRNITSRQAEMFHLAKTNFFKEKGITIIHIFENEWKNKQEIVKSIILSKIGKTPNKIYARQCEIKDVPHQESSIFLMKNHIQGSIINSYKNIGLYFQDELVSLLTLGSPRSNNGFDFEIHRFCNKLNVSVVGGFSKLFKHFLKNNPNKSVMTYADKRYSTGNLYASNGFTLLRESEPNYFYFKKDSLLLESRNKYQKHKLKDIFENVDENKTESQIMDENGYDKIFDCGNYVFGYGNPMK